MRDKIKYDLDFRPETYWDVPEVAIANIKGGWRKKVAADAIRNGTIEEVSDEILADSLSEGARIFAGMLHPCFMGGEYLPDYDAEEVEIARVSLKSVTADQISIRARRTGSHIVHSSKPTG